MKRIFLWLLFGACLSTSWAEAQDELYVHRKDGVVLGTGITSTDSMTVNTAQDSLLLHINGTSYPIAIADIDSLTLGESQSYVSAVWDGTSVRVINPFAFSGITITATGGQVTVQSLASSDINYMLSGSGTGGFKLYGSTKETVTLSGLTLTGSTGPALNFQCKKKNEIVLAEGTTNTLADASTYTSDGTEDMKGTIFGEGQIILSGTGSLYIKSNVKHAICSDDYVKLNNGNIHITGAASDGIHANDYFTMDGGTLTVSGTTGDCVDADAGYVEINDGKLNLTVATADTKALKCDSVCTINGGTHQFTLTGATTKGIKAGKVCVKGGTMTFTCSGSATLTNYEASYCTAIKSDSIFYMTDGAITVNHSGIAGKGISADIGVNIAGGTIDITTTGSGQKYTTASNTTDTYAACGISSDGYVHITGGTQTLNSSGSGGKGIKADGEAVFGGSTSGPTLTATTTGAAVYTSSSSWGGGGGFGPGGGGGGGGQATYYGKPKAIKVTGAITINSGNITASTSKASAEGIESKSNITVNGGYVSSTAYDDAINAAGTITFNGGYTYAYASNNDGIDSNYGKQGAIAIYGGVVMAHGTSSPEEGLDADNNSYLIIKGGTLFSSGGSQSTSGSPTCSQPVIMLSNKSLTAGYFTVANSSGTVLFSCKVPRAMSGDYSYLTCPSFTSGSTYKYGISSSAPSGTTSSWDSLYSVGGTSSVSSWTSFTCSSGYSTK